MLMLTRRWTAAEAPPARAREITATLPLDVRLKSRARIRLDDGREAGFVLPRGHLIRGGDVLADDGATHRVRIVAADESVSTVRCDDPLMLARACYHLGNRHVPLQIGEGFARYQHDHVLDEMLRQMGLDVLAEQAPFEPEAGAYRQDGHAHGHDGHGHHRHDHRHDHGHGLGFGGKSGCASSAG